MTKEEESLLVIAVLYLMREAEDVVPRAVDAVVKPVERAGAHAYEATHDASHDEDLPANAAQRWTKAELVKLATDAGFADPHTAAAIALAESNGDPHAHGDGETSFGLWQIHLPSHPEYSRDEMLDPYANSSAALDISKGGTDWRAWSTWWGDAKHRTGPGEGAFKRHL